MRKMYKLCFAAVTALLLGGLTSCDPSNKDPEGTATADVMVNPPVSGKAPATSADFKLSTQNIESYAYVIDEKADAKTPAPEFIYAETKEIIAAKGGNEDIAIYGFEGSKTYTVHFAFKVKGENKYLSKSVGLTTGAFDQLLTIVELEHKAYKVHVNVPQGMYYRWVVTERFNYESLKAQFGYTDLDFVDDGFVDQGPKTFYIKNGDILKEYGEGIDPWRAEVYPGMAMVALFAECDKDGNIEFEFNGDGGGGGILGQPSKVSSSQPNLGEYTEEFTSTDLTLPGLFARQFLWTKAPQVVEGKFTVEREITERNAYFRVTPPANIKQYGVAFWAASDLVTLTERLGEDGVWEYLQRTMQPQTEPIVVSAAQTMMLVKDIEYKMFIVGQTDKDGLIQIHQVEDFKLIESDKPAIELVITAVPAPENSPYHVSFNVKAPNKDASAVKYLMNTTAEWIYYLNDGGSYEAQMGQYGNPLNAAAIAEINSDKGHTMTFDSWENTENRLVLASYNADEKEKIFVGDTKSLPEPAKEKVESPLFTSLLGEWNMTYKFKDDMFPDEVFTGNFITKISDRPAPAAANFGDGSDGYAELFDYFKAQGIRNNEPDPEAYATAQIKQYYDEYSEATDRFKTKYREQNRLLLEGFAYRDPAMYFAFQYMSSWDLFLNVYYNAYTTDQLFHDFGPKLFFEIGKDGNVTLETNPQFIAPCSNYNQMGSLIVCGQDAAVTNNYFGNFDVEVIDENTLHIKTTKEFEGTDYTFATIISTYGSPIRDSYAAGDIIMERVVGPAPAPRYVPSSGGGKTVNIKLPNTYKATAIDVIKAKPRTFVEVQIPVWQAPSYEELQKSYPHNRMK